jgi:hypothetical protein
MVIGYCDKVPRNTGMTPMPSRKPGATEFTYQRTVEPQPKLGAWLPRMTENGQATEVGAALECVDWPLQALRLPQNSPRPLRRMRRLTWDDNRGGEGRW